MTETRDARETRDRLNEIFNQYPPSVREVLRIDPTLMYRADYIANYPMLAAFLEQHPEIAHNPRSSSASAGSRSRTTIRGSKRARASAQRRRVRRYRAHRHDHHDRHHLSRAEPSSNTGAGSAPCKAQNELNTKLIDRFASSDDLLAYLQSPQGKVLTEPPALPQAAPRGDGRAAQPDLLVAAVGHRARRARAPD